MSAEKKRAPKPHDELLAENEELQRQLDWMNQERELAQKRLGFTQTGLWEDILNHYDSQRGYDFAASLDGIKIDQTAKVGGMVFLPGTTVGTVIQAAFEAYARVRQRRLPVDDGQPRGEFDADMKEFVHPLFLHKMPIATQLRAVASQEQNDGPDYDLMMAAADKLDDQEAELKASEEALKDEVKERRRQASMFSDHLLALRDRFAQPLKDALSSLNFANERIGFTHDGSYKEWKSKVESTIDKLKELLA